MIAKNIYNFSFEHVSNHAGNALSNCKFVITSLSVYEYLFTIATRLHGIYIYFEADDNFHIPGRFANLSVRWAGPVPAYSLFLSFTPSGPFSSYNVTRFIKQHRFNTCRFYRNSLVERFAILSYFSTTFDSSFIVS